MCCLSILEAGSPRSGVGKATPPPEAHGEAPPCLLPLLRFAALGMPHRSLPASVVTWCLRVCPRVVFSLWASLCPNFSRVMRVPDSGLDPTRIQCDLMTISHLQGPYFKIRSYSHVLGIKTSTDLLNRYILTNVFFLGGDTIQPIISDNNPLEYR